MYLLDTNVISQFARRQPDPGVAGFLEQARADSAEVFLSALTVGEVRKGIAKLKRYGDQDQADMLQRWLTHLREEYAERILAIDADVGELWGAMLAATNDTNAVDKLIAATALQYGLTLVTRNVGHVAGTGVNCIDPFASGQA